MNGLLAQLMAALAALTAIGLPVEAKKMPDRPAIVQPLPASAKSVAPASNPGKSSVGSAKARDDSGKSLDNSSKANRIEITGAIKSIKNDGSATTIVVGNQIIIVDAKTKVTGKLDVGVKIQIEAIQQSNGSLLASTVEVKKADANVNPSDDKNSSTLKTDDTKKEDKSVIKSGSDDSPSHDLNNDGGSKDDSASHDQNDDKSGSGDKSGSDSNADDSKSSDDKSGHK